MGNHPPAGQATSFSLIVNELNRLACKILQDGVVEHGLPLMNIFVYLTRHENNKIFYLLIPEYKQTY